MPFSAPVACFWARTGVYIWHRTETALNGTLWRCVPFIYTFISVLNVCKRLSSNISDICLRPSKKAITFASVYKKTQDKKTLAKKMADIQVLDGGAGRQGTLAIQSLNVGGVNMQGTIVDSQMVQNRINPTIQFNIDNSGVGATNQQIRIGGHIAEPDSYILFDQAPGASDDGVIQDDNGVGCAKVQGFSKLVTSKPVLIRRVKVISSNPLQLAQTLSYASLQYDGTRDVIQNNTAMTQDKSDQRSDILDVTGAWLLDAQQYLEFTALAGEQFIILIEIVAAGSATILNSVNR